MKTMIKNVKFLISVIVVSILGVAFFIAFACKGMWDNAFIVLAMIAVVVIAYFATNNAISIKYNNKIVRYRNAEYNWNEVKVTLIFKVDKLNYQNYMYYLVFGDSFKYGDDAMNSLQDGFWAYLSSWNLRIIAQLYQDKIAIVNLDGSPATVEELQFDKKNKQIIIDHNKKFE